MGKNLLVIAQLEGVDLELYTTTVLPRVLEQARFPCSTRYFLPCQGANSWRSLHQRRPPGVRCEPPSSGADLRVSLRW